MRCAVDTNVLAYAEGVNGPARKADALEIVGKLSPEDTFLPVQVLGELFHLLVRKAKWPPRQARDAVLSWQDLYPLIETSAGVLLSASDLAIQHRLGIWDAVALSAAAAAGCRWFLSEDMQSGFTWHGVTIVNPFDPVQFDLEGGLAK
jgi:predicted nucleic acid-binding protein